ncbi:MAG: ATP-binding cassette domain-containing protein [Defluviitaleaceae bacterium]|nr:ATP-binding cassette domain-containing protein [Defluviitaleaceae bacterium]
MSKFIMHNLTFAYSDYYSPLFDNVNLEIDASWKLGLIGRNARGKTTLLKLLHGKLKSTGGQIVSSVSTELFPYDTNKTYENVADFIKENVGKFKSVEDTLKHYEENGQTGDPLYIEMLTKYYEDGGSTIEADIEKEFFRMGLNSEILRRDWETLSGGERTKIMIIILFLRNPDFVLLDEPTNHLDAKGRNDLANYLQRKQGYIIVSHDIEFLDKTVKHILSINRSNIYIEKGNFTSWKANKDNYEEYEKRQKKNLENKMVQLEKAAENSRKWSDNSNTKKYAYAGHSRNRSLRLMKSAVVAERNIAKSIGKINTMLGNYEEVKPLSFSQTAFGDDVMIAAENLGFAYLDKCLFKGLSFEINSGDRILISGANGTGKSTLLNIITGQTSLQQGSLHINEALQISYSKQIPKFCENYYEVLENNKDAIEKFKYLLTVFDLKADYVQRPWQFMSDGERKKVDIAKSLATPHNLLILDEPLNFTDIYFRKQLSEAIIALKPTMVFVEHDVEFCRNIATKVVSL